MEDGIYFFENAEFSDKYMQLDDNGDDFFELHDFDGANDQRWQITHVENGYYNITSK